MSESRPPQRVRVLIVEDEPRLRELLLDVVPDLGFDAAAARSAEQALRLMQADPFDILILDLHLPLMGGMDLFETVRSKWPRTQVIVLTAYGDLAAAQRAIHLDVVEFLSKPCHLDELERALDRARRRLPSTVPGAAAEAPPADVAPAGQELSLAETEYRQIVAALRRHHGNRTAAAAELGISRRTLHYKLAAYRRENRPID